MSASNTLFSSGQTSGIAAGLNQNFRNSGRAVWRQDLTTNVSVESQLVQHGFNSCSWNTTSKFSTVTTVTLPVAFDDTSYDIIVTPLGYNNGGPPTSRTNVPNGIAFTAGSVLIVNAASFQVRFGTIDGSDNVAGAYVAFSWIAIGTKI